MTFQTNIPIAFENISSSTDDIQTNFAVANTTFGEDHYAFDDTDQGKHKFTRLVFQNDAAAAADNELILRTDELRESAGRLTIVQNHPTGISLPVVPSMQLVGTLTSGGKINARGKPLNVDFRTSTGYSGLILTIRFLDFFNDDNYHIDISLGGVRLPATVISKSREEFTLRNGANWQIGTRIYVRAY